jgi:hypothetical protein
LDADLQAGALDDDADRPLGCTIDLPSDRHRGNELPVTEDSEIQYERPGQSGILGASPTGETPPVPMSNHPHWWNSTSTGGKLAWVSS